MAAHADAPNPVKCSGCGTPRSADLAQVIPRPLCPDCGATALTWNVVISDSVKVTDSLSATLTPADQGRDWQRRWEEVQRELGALDAPHSEPLSGESIHAAAHRLHSFFIQAYHLKDALKADTPSHGVAGKTIEDAITAEPELALLADLANLDKHFKLTKPPRSGHPPVVGTLQGSSSEVDGWRFVMPISHDGKTVDGLAAARAGVAAWRRRLTAWRLI
jgi:hypothetical protein